METFNQWAIKNLGEWVTEFAALFLVIAVALVLVIIIMLFCIVGSAARRKKKALAAAQKQAENPNTAGEPDLAALEAQIRAELEQEYAANVPERAYDDAPVDNGEADALRAQNAELCEELRRKDEYIAELAAERDNAVATAASATASSEHVGQDGANNTAELYAQIDELERAVETLNAELADLRNENAELRDAAANAAVGSQQPASDESARYEAEIAELNRAIKDRESEINLLKAENAQIKAQALQQQLADSRAREKEKADAARRRADNTEPRRREKEPLPDTDRTPDNEDEYDEYYDDYGDASSAVKVTLKFDRVKNSWIILRSDTDRTYRRLATKQDALLVAKDLARRLHAQLVVHKKDGRFQKI